MRSTTDMLNLPQKGAKSAKSCHTACLVTPENCQEIRITESDHHNESDKFGGIAVS